jgi:hypothetical protein
MLLPSCWAFVRTEDAGRPISEAIWAEEYFCAMFFSFARSSDVHVVAFGS